MRYKSIPPLLLKVEELLEGTSTGKCPGEASHNSSFLAQKLGMPYCLISEDIGRTELWILYKTCSASLFVYNIHSVVTFFGKVWLCFCFILQVGKVHWAKFSTG